MSAPAAVGGADWRAVARTVLHPDPGPRSMRESDAETIGTLIALSIHRAISTGQLDTEARGMTNYQLNIGAKRIQLASSAVCAT